MKKNIGIRSLVCGSILSLAMLSIGANSAFSQNPPPGGGGGPPQGGPGGAGGGGAGGPGGAGGGGAPDPQQFVDRMMANDANGDGKLAKDEVPGGFADRLFEQGDANKDGFLTADELKAIASRQGGPGGGGRGGQGGAGGGQPLSFEAYMSMANRNIRTLSRSAFDEASREADMTAICGIELALVGAKSRLATVEMAPQAKEKYGSDEAAFRRDLRAGLLTAIMAAFELDNAIAAGDSAEAKKCLAKLVEAEKAGHTAFQPPREERGPGGPGGGGAGGRGGAGGQGGQGGQAGGGAGG